MLESDLLIMWLPGRALPGGLLTEVAKHRLSAVPGSVEPPIRAWYRGRAGLLWSVVGFVGDWGQGGVLLPEPVHALLDGVSGANPDGFEAILWEEPGDLHTQITARRGRLYGRWRPGVRYRVLG